MKSSNAKFLLSVTVLGLFLGAPAAAQSGSASLEARTGATLNLAVNKSQTLQTSQVFSRIAVGNPDIADVAPVTSSVAYVLGKQIGTTNVTMYNSKGGVIAVVDINVTPDAMGLKQKLAEILPIEKLGVQVANDSLVLSGTASSALAVKRAMTIAEAYAPGKVINMLGVGSSQQILLEVRFAEMQRGTVKALGIGTVNYGNLGGSPTASNGGAIASPSTGVGAIGTYSAQLNFPGLSVTLQALEQQGLVRTLAQPNIIALSGETANFLAGGEFPVPTGVAINGQVQIDFKQFGVGLAFTPTLLEDGLINLVVAPEVSSLDPTAGIDVNGLRIPGLNVRRARTTLELRDSQTFALAGLIQSDFRNTVSRIPLLGRIPIIGALFRSQSFQRQETELVILVTPRIVRPLPSGTALQVPTDRAAEPDDAAFFLLGKSEKQLPARPALPLPGPENASNKPGGITAEHGHIVR